MPIANKYIFLLIFTAFSGAAFSQSADTIKSKPFDRYWTKPRLIPKFGGGIQGSAFVEAGLQWHKIYVHPFTLASAGPYVTADVVFRNTDVIVGPKAGYELTVGLLGLAADVGYYTDFERESVLITPKLGVTLLGFASVYYGHSFNLSEDTFGAMSQHRFSLTINLNRDYFDLREARRKH